MFSKNCLVLLTGFVLLQITCRQPDYDQDRLYSPVYGAKEAIGMMKANPGFTVQLVAAEPLIQAPVAILFDNHQRIWVVEMSGYMPDTLGTGEDQPSGKIVIISDENGDGQMDHRRVFLDSLILPRAISFVNNGILVAEPPNLWFVEINNDSAGKKTLIDSSYAVGGNPEHQPNGLVRTLDNWIYSAESGKRYRYQNGRWLISATMMRGQWGLSPDDAGRLFYNNNSQNLLGDFFPPAFALENPVLRQRPGFNEVIVSDNRVYPIRPTPGVNRGYQENILDENQRLLNFTAACGPAIYRGGLFPQQYHHNAFVAEPAANLIKRNILTESSNRISGRQAYTQQEFLASSDERFRPVNLYNAPDGALYIVDMYRGIIQHKTYITPYLNEQINARSLSAPLNCGRIYRIVPDKISSSIPVIPDEAEALLPLLKSSNGWLRDRAQHLLVDKQDPRIIPGLRRMLREATDPYTITHSLWTMEGMNALTLSDIQPLVGRKPFVDRQIISLSAYFAQGQWSAEFLEILTDYLDVDLGYYPYIAFALKFFFKQYPILVRDLAFQLLEKAPDDHFLATAIIDLYQHKEQDLLNELYARGKDSSLLLVRNLIDLQPALAIQKQQNQLEYSRGLHPRGADLYSTICQSCHGIDGNGMALLAPPLNQSEWVSGDKVSLIAITIFGLTGPVDVGGKTYQQPEVGDMPGLGMNGQLSDEDIAEILNYIRTAWGKTDDSVEASEVRSVKKRYAGRKEPFTQKELQKQK